MEFFTFTQLSLQCFVNITLLREVSKTTMLSKILLDYKVSILSSSNATYHSSSIPHTSTYVLLGVNPFGLRWMEAKQSCASYGSQMITITSEAERFFLRSPITELSTSEVIVRLLSSSIIFVGLHYAQA